MWGCDKKCVFLESLQNRHASSASGAPTAWQNGIPYAEGNQIRYK